MILRTFDKPTNVYLIGYRFDGENLTEFGITDDEYTYKLNVGDRKKYVTTEGNLTIMSEEEFMEYNILDEVNEFENFRSIVILKNYVGDILGKVVDDEEDSNIEFDFSDKDEILYSLIHEQEDDDEDDDIYDKYDLIFSVETNDCEYIVFEDNSLENYQLSYLRDKKINEILK